MSYSDNYDELWDFDYDFDFLDEVISEEDWENYHQDGWADWDDDDYE